MLTVFLQFIYLNIKVIVKQINFKEELKFIKLVEGKTSLNFALLVVKP